MNIKTLKRAIEDKNWSLVQQFYSDMTGEDILEEKAEDQPKAKKTDRPKKDKAKPKTSNDEMTFYGGEDLNDQEDAVVRRAAKKIPKPTRASRKEYEPDIQTCQGCGSKFDKNKSINSFFIGDSGDGKIENYCNKCAGTKKT